MPDIASNPVVEWQEFARRELIRLRKESMKLETLENLQRKEIEKHHFESELIRICKAREAHEKDLAHRKAVHSAALAAFVQAGLTLDMAGTALEVIVRGAIPHIMVVY